MKKLYFFLCIMASMILSAICPSVYADNENIVEDGLYYLSIRTENDLQVAVYNGEALIIKCSDKMAGSVVLPSDFKSIPITGIAGGAFAGCNYITRVYIPASIVSIGEKVLDIEYNEAADDPSGTGEPQDPYWVRGIVSEGYASVFDRCSRLAAFVVDPANPAFCTVDGVLFSKDKSVVYRSPAVSSVSQINIPMTVRAIKASAFMAVTGLETVTIPETVEEIGEYAFANCSSLKKAEIYANGLADSMFSGCTLLESVTLSSGLKEVANSAFRNSSALNNIELPDTITKIENYAFYRTGIQKITIPAQVQAVGLYAFGDCSALSEIVFEGNAPAINSYLFGMSLKQNITAFYSKHKEGWAEKTLPTCGGRVSWVPQEEYVFSLAREEYLADVSAYFSGSALPAETPSDITARSIQDMQKTVSEDLPDLEYAGQTLILSGDKVTIRQVFHNKLDRNFQFYLDNNPVEPLSQGQYLIIEISDLSAENFDEMHTVQAVSTDGSSEILTVTASALSYAYSQLVIDETDACAQLMRAMVRFWAAAEKL